MSGETTEELQAERARLESAIAALSPDLGRPEPGRKVPSATSAKLTMLQRQLATLNYKLRQSRTKATTDA